MGWTDFKANNAENIAAIAWFIESKGLIVTADKFTDDVVHFDMLPIILDSLGFKYPKGRLGLGYSALKPIRSLPPADRLPVMDYKIDNYSKTYNRLWNSY